jgi:hypothetical protein
VIYSLHDLGEDPAFCQWIAETIPEVIEPASWKCSDASGKKPVLRYYEPKKILVVCHTAAVHAKVDRFLKAMKEALPRQTRGPVAGKAPMKDHGVVPARFQAPGLLNPPPPAPEPNAVYPVPPPARQPKHLFHFIIRYEGAGIIDSNVVKFMKAQAGQQPSVSEPEKKENEDSDASERTVRSAIGVGCPENDKKGKKVKEENEFPAPPFTDSKKESDKKEDKKDMTTQETQPGDQKTDKEKKEDNKS